MQSINRGFLMAYAVFEKSFGQDKQFFSSFICRNFTLLSSEVFIFVEKRLLSVCALP